MSFQSLVETYSINSVSYFTLANLSRNELYKEELVHFLLKTGLLGDRSGKCDYCEEGNVHLTRKENTFYWKCGQRAYLKTISLRKSLFFENSKLSFG